MKWMYVSENWLVFFEVIIEKWFEVDEVELDEIDGDQCVFICYILEVIGQEIEEICDEICEWLVGEILFDVVMDFMYDGYFIVLLVKYVGEGEDEYDDDVCFGDDDDVEDRD